MVDTVLNKNKFNNINVKGHIETNNLIIQNIIIQNSKIQKNSNNQLIEKIYNIIKTENLKNNYIENKKKIIDLCINNSNKIFKKKKKQFVMRYKKKIDNILMSKQLRSLISYNEIK